MKTFMKFLLQFFGAVDPADIGNSYPPPVLFVGDAKQQEPRPVPVVDDLLLVDLTLLEALADRFYDHHYYPLPK